MNAVSRRTILQIPGLALAEHVISRCPGAITFGSNSHAWPGFSRNIPEGGVVRDYWHGLNYLQDRWPDFGRARVVLSVEPHPADLLDGKLDARFLRLAATAPPGSMLVPWYEAGPANPRDYYSFACNPANVRACQWYLHHLLRQTNVLVGSIICGPAIQLHEWMAPALDWYGVDINGDWFRRGEQFEVARFHRRQAENLAVWRRKAGGRVRLVVAETNCTLDEVRGPWFRLLASWISAQRLLSADVCTLWTAPGRRKRDNDRPQASPAAVGPGNWPPSEATIRALRELATRYDPGKNCLPGGWGRP